MKNVSKVLKEISLLCITISILSFAVSAKGFEKSRNYEKDSFKDVQESDWFYLNVVDSYETGLINGKSENYFDPNGSMTVAESITIASRLHATFNNAKIENLANAKNWYDQYVTYAEKSGFLKESMFNKYDREITRIELAYLMSMALPEDFYLPINSIKTIPDVASEIIYFDELLRLYNAGVVMGSDEYGNFLPESNIKRCEVAAIISRVTNPKIRIKKDLLPIENVLNLDTFSKRSFELRYLFAIKSFQDPSEISSNKLIQYAFCHMYYENLTDMPKKVGITYREAGIDEIQKVLYNHFNIDKIEYEKSDLYNISKKTFEIWEPDYQKTLYFNNELTDEGNSTFLITTYFYATEEKTEIKGTCEMRVKSEADRTYILNFNSK